jgi:hypothetical protein
MSQYEFLEKMDKTKFRIVKRGEEDDDVEFWQSQPYEVRLMVIEMLRQEFYNYTDETIPRLQRVYTIAQRE